MHIFCDLDRTISQKSILGKNPLKIDKNLLILTSWPLAGNYVHFFQRRSKIIYNLL